MKAARDASRHGVDGISGDEPRLPDHETIYRRLRDMILFGDLIPGQAVTIQGMQAATGAGMTPVREALRRLVAEGALETGDNRRISVPRITAAELDEIAYARLAIEPRLAALAATKLDAAAIDALREWDRKVDAAILAGDVGGYLTGNHHFHFKLYAAAEAEILQRIAMSLWLRIGPALRVVCGRYGTSGLPDQHRDAVAALAAGDAARTAAAIEADIRQGVDLVREAAR